MQQTIAQRFKQQLNHKEVLVGTFVKTPSMMIAEVLASTQLDVLCFDAEHSPFDRKDIDAAILASNAGNIASLVRVPNSQKDTLLNVLDCNASGVVVPHVNSAQLARDIVKVCHFGEGGRGYAGSTRFAGYGQYSVAENLEREQTQVSVVLQIEDLSALEEIQQIVSVEGVDCIFIGLMDLTVALGETSPYAENVKKVLNIIVDAANNASKPIGMFLPNFDELDYWQRQGVSLFLMGSDHSFMKQGANALFQRIKNT